MLYLIIIFSYLFGAIPFAYIIVKLIDRADIRKQGTGNIGAMNSYDITGKKWIGILVFFLDALKGLLAVVLTSIIIPGNFLALAYSSLFVIIGHNYSIFLKFKGGRGLSSAVGISIFLNPIFIAIWGLVWLLSYLFISKNIHIENSLAIILSPIIFYLLPASTISHLLFFDYLPILNIKVLYAVLSLLLMMKHIIPLWEVLKTK